QPKRAADRQRQRRDPAEPGRILQRPEIDDERRRDAESGDVGQGIKLGAEAAVGAQQASDASVHAIENAGSDDAGQRKLPLLVDRHADTCQADTQSQRRHRIGPNGAKRDAAGAPPLGHWLAPPRPGSTPSTPSTVSPAMVLWPSSTSLPVPAGKKRYTP